MPLASVGKDGTTVSTNIVVPNRVAVKPDPPVSSKPVLSPWIPVATAVLILVAFVILFNHVLQRSAIIDDKHQYLWDRLLLLYNSVQTIVVAAASALLGVQVSAAQVAAARASGAQSEARVTQLESNIKSFQNTIKNRVGGSERGLSSASLNAAIIADSMMLLH